MKPPRFFVHWLEDRHLRRRIRRLEKKREVLLSLPQNEYTEAALEENDKEHGRCLEAYTRAS
jgi:hypothetical protein